MVAPSKTTSVAALACLLVPNSLGFHNLLDYSRKVAILTGCGCASHYGRLVIMAVQLHQEALWQSQNKKSFNTF